MNQDNCQFIGGVVLMLSRRGFHISHFGSNLVFSYLSHVFTSTISLLLGFSSQFLRGVPHSREAPEAMLVPGTRINLAPTNQNNHFISLAVQETYLARNCSIAAFHIQEAATSPASAPNQNIKQVPGMCIVRICFPYIYSLYNDHIQGPRLGPD